MKNNSSSGSGKKIDEYTLRTKINDELSIIKEKNKFINSKLITSETQQIPFGLINRNLIDISNILLEISVNLQTLSELIAKKEDDPSKENLQLAHSRLTKVYTQEKTTYQTLKTKFNLIEESYNVTNQFNINGYDDSVDENKNNISRNDLFYADHNAKKSEDINNIYQQTLMVAKISKDINTISNRQEDMLHSIEHNIKEADTKVIKANEHIMKKNEDNKKKYSNNFSLFVFLLILLIIIVYILFFRGSKGKSSPKTKPK